MNQNKVYVYVCENNQRWQDVFMNIYLKVFGEKLQERDIQKNEFGKPICNSCFFSISHSKKLLALAFSKDIKIGIDIQISKLHTNPNKFIEKILTDEEKKTISQISKDNLIKYWTKKESIFKLNGNEKTFNPNKIQTDNYFFFEKEIHYDSDVYYLTIASKNQFNFIFI